MSRRIPGDRSLVAGHAAVRCRLRRGGTQRRTQPVRYPGDERAGACWRRPVRCGGHVRHRAQPWPSCSPRFSSTCGTPLRPEPGAEQPAGTAQEALAASVTDEHSASRSRPDAAPATTDRAGLSVFVIWNAGTLLGSPLSTQIPDPAALGVDFVFPLASALLLPCCVAAPTGSWRSAAACWPSSSRSWSAGRHDHADRRHRLAAGCPLKAVTEGRRMSAHGHRADGWSPSCHAGWAWLSGRPVPPFYLWLFRFVPIAVFPALIVPETPGLMRQSSGWRHCHRCCGAALLSGRACWPAWLPLAAALVRRLNSLFSQPGPWSARGTVTARDAPALTRTSTSRGAFSRLNVMAPRVSFTLRYDPASSAGMTAQSSARAVADRTPAAHHHREPAKPTSASQVTHRGDVDSVSGVAVQVGRSVHRSRGSGAARG